GQSTRYMVGVREREYSGSVARYEQAGWSCLLPWRRRTGCCRYDDVVTVWPELFDGRELGKPPLGPTTCEHGDQVDRLHDQGARHGDDGFLDELLQTTQRTECRAGMNGADPAGMPGAPRLEEVKRFGTPHLTDRDAVRPQPKRRAHEIGERRDPVLG